MDYSSWYQPPSMANEQWTMNYSPWYLHLSMANGNWTMEVHDIPPRVWPKKSGPWTIVHGIDRQL